MSSLSPCSSQQVGACCGVWGHTTLSCPADSPIEHGPQPRWRAALCLPCTCRWHSSPGGDHPSHHLHSSTVTPCPEQPHAAEGPPQGCPFFWWQWWKGWKKVSFKWLCFRDIFTLTLLHLGGLSFLWGGQEWDFKAFANMTILKVTGWMKALDNPFKLLNSQSLRVI